MHSERIFGNEKDPELAQLQGFLLSNHQQTDTILDIGPWCEGSTKVCSLHTKQLETIDLKHRTALEKMVRKQWVEDYLFADLPEYDFVVCVSTLEHIGVTPLKMLDPREMQLFAVQKILDQAKKGVFLTFPYGQPVLYKQNYFNIDRTMVAEMENMAKGFDVTKKFLTTKTPKLPDSWREVSQKQADRAENKLKEGTLTIAIISMLRCKKKGGD